MKKKRWYSGHLLSDPLFSIFGKAGQKEISILHTVSNNYKKSTRTSLKIA